VPVGDAQGTDAVREGPLTGIRVLDLTRVLAGPHCGRMLADMGADVIKVEPPEGDMTRFSWPRVNSIATYFAQQNVGKRNVSMDMKRPEAVELLMTMAEHCDVLLENFRPGVMARMGLGHEMVAARNPRLVYLSLSGYGATGPWTHRRAYAPVVGAESGFTGEQAWQAHRPVTNDAFSHADVYTAMEAAYAVVAALFQRERTGRGQHIDVSMAETMLYVNEHAHWMIAGKPDESDSEVPSFSPAEYPVMPTSDGRDMICAGHPAARGTFERFAAACAFTELVDDPRMATVRSRREHLPVLFAAINAWTSRHTAAEVEAAFDAVGLATGVVRGVDEIADTDWARARGAVVDIDDRRGGTIRVPNAPWHLSDARTGITPGERPRYRGEDNRAVIAELCGLDDAELDRLEAEGILTARVPGR
jgi:CoA:oxalate CoA-transferase